MTSYAVTILGCAVVQIFFVTLCWWLHFLPCCSHMNSNSSSEVTLHAPQVTRILCHPPDAFLSFSSFPALSPAGDTEGAARHSFCYNSRKHRWLWDFTHSQSNTAGILFSAQVGKVNRNTDCKPIFVFSIFFYSILFIHERLTEDNFVFVFLKNLLCAVCLYIATCVYYLGMENCWEIVCCIIIILLHHLTVVPQLVGRCHYTRVFLQCYWQNV